MELTSAEFTRLANNYRNSCTEDKNLFTHLRDFGNYHKEHKDDLNKKYKVALCFICLNAPYWEFAKDAIEGAREHFLPGHEVDHFLWSDMPEEIHYGATVFPTEGIEWPMPTLLRYDLMLQQEEVLSKYDYIFYCDIDMRWMDIVGDEVLADGITACQHPMYALRKEFQAPYEPNPESQAYIKAPKYYFAGGFQGGRTTEWIQAMKVMRDSIDKDLENNYMARWNDESHWNKYLFDNPPALVLNPSYIYPDSLIEEYYMKVWGKNYPPKLMTLTKKFTTTSEGGQAVRDIMQTL